MNTTNYNPDRAWTSVQDLLEKIVKKEQHIAELKKHYSREKVAIEAKVNSATALKNSIYKNVKVENKISSYDSNADAKLQYYDEQIKLNEEKRTKDISNAREKYEVKINELKARMAAEFNDIDSRADKYQNYILSQRKIVETKKDNVIRDLSANIIVPNIGDSFDEDAYPRLTRLKHDIEVEEEELLELKKSKEEKFNFWDMCCKRRDKALAEANRMRDLQLQRQEELRIQEARQAAAEERERTRLADEARWERQKQERIKAAKEKETEDNFKTNVLPNLSDEHKSCYKAMSLDMRKEVQDMTLSQASHHIEQLKDKLTKYAKLEKLSADDIDNKYFTSNIWDMYNDLPYEKRFAIAQMNKMAQLAHIKQYHAELDPSDSEDTEKED